jgi:hypothetical protein
MAVQATTSQEIPKKRRLPSPSQQAVARTPAVRLVAPTNRGIAANDEQAFSQNFGQYAREQQEEAAEPEPIFQRGKLNQVKSAVTLSLKHREAIKNGDFSVFIPALAFAIAKDGLFDFVPIIGNVLGLFISVYLFIFLFGKGTWKIRIVIFLLSLADVIPAVNLIPMSTICVLYVYYKAKKYSIKVKEELAVAGITI